MNYTLTLPEGYSWNTYFTAWDRENTKIDSRGYLTSHLYNKVSVSEDGRVLTVTPANSEIGAPDGRVPLYTKDVPKLYKFDVIIEGKSALELAEAMECRLYTGGTGRTRMKVLRCTARDFIFLFVMLAICVGIFFLNGYEIIR